MRALLRTEVWIHGTIRHELFDRAFKRMFPHGEITNMVDDADPEGHPNLRFVKVMTFSDEEAKFWEFFDRFTTLHGFEPTCEPRTSFPRPGPPFD